MKRTIIILVIGVMIIAGALALAAIEVDCPQCNKHGVIECLVCQGREVVLGEIFWVECGCRGENPVCQICQGFGGTSRQVLKPCRECGARGEKICSFCEGRGKIWANQWILMSLSLK